MTIAATRVFELDIDAIIRQAFRTAALANEHTILSAEKVGDAKEKLEIIVDELSLEGLLDRMMTTEDVTLVAADDTYSLSANTLDVVGIAVIPDGITLGSVTREEMLILKQTDSEGPPSSYFVDRSTVPLSVRFWPTPATDDAGDVVTFQVHRLRADNQTGSDTPDVERYFTGYLVYQLAHELAVSGGRDPSACGYLRARAQEKLDKCKPQAKRRGPGRVQLISPTQWNR